MLLAIDTATAACSVALIDGSVVVAQVYEEVGRGHAERLIGMIAALPSGGQAEAVLVNCGPGSFTGVRVGLAAARALGFAWGAPVTGYSTHALLAATAFADHSEVEAASVIIDAGHGAYFVQNFRRAPFLDLTPLASLEPDAAITVVGGLPIITNGPDKIRGIAPESKILPATLMAGRAILLPNAYTQGSPSPIYGREPDAKLPK
jgi:tRNA threonylcarbamoyladenosine biosynthesis protein TsaB